jgi:hypothetical protein
VEVLGFIGFAKKYSHHCSQPSIDVQFLYFEEDSRKLATKKPLLRYSEAAL